MLPSYHATCYMLDFIEYWLSVADFIFILPFIFGCLGLENIIYNIKQQKMLKELNLEK